MTVFSIQVVELAVMAARQHAHRAHFSIDIVEVHADGERAEIGV